MRLMKVGVASDHRGIKVKTQILGLLSQLAHEGVDYGPTDGASVDYPDNAVMVFSGYTLAELRARPDAAPLLALTDLLVDGPYDRARPEPPPPAGRRWIGSTNQVMHHLTGAYAPDEPRMRAPNTVELHWRDGRLLVNGWPAGADVLADGLRRDRRRPPS
jgi:hypothetical protein